MTSTSDAPELATAASTPPALPPLTSFSPPSKCLGDGAFFEFKSDSSTYYIQGPRGVQTSCFPPSYSANTNTFYSPGWCPDGYTEAHSWTKTLSPLTETHFTCCPSIGNTVFQTQGTKNLAEWQSTLGCVSTFTAPITVPTVKTVDGGSVTADTKTVTISPSGGTGVINAYSIHVARRASDTPGPSSTGNGNGNSSSIDRGTAIGIGVGVGVAVLLMVIGAYLFWRRRRALQLDKERQAYAPVSPVTRNPFSPVEMPASPAAVDPAKKDTSNEPAELPSRENEIAGARSPEQQTPLAEVMGDALPPGSTHLRDP
ncbi:hypothetical protein F5Y15DRAFT_366109 [Xylariaceae sp. FL0016]|nr:hypothetical protein F5Y15DRAFT_366109 [Xylariaceae sp. FL0016]